MIRVLGTILAGLLGLAFGSFLNVCLSRWPQGESVVTPRSHCRTCGRTLTWWENIPIASWLALRARCRTCKTKISWRYPVVEGTVVMLWGTVAWRFLGFALDADIPATSPFLHFNLYNSLLAALGRLFLLWLLVALAVLDAEHLWLPDWLTFPGIFLGFVLSMIYRIAQDRFSDGPSPSIWSVVATSAFSSVIGITVAAGLVLLIRWTYWLIRRLEGIGLGDAKLMAMLGAWLGLSGGLLSFAVGVVLGAVFALILLAIPAARRESDTWLAAKLPLGTFLCIGGIISALWGQPIINAYLQWAGF